MSDAKQDSTKLQLPVVEGISEEIVKGAFEEDPEAFGAIAVEEPSSEESKEPVDEKAPEDVDGTTEKTPEDSQDPKELEEPKDLKTVPLEALREERQRRQELQQQMSELELKLIKLATAQQQQQEAKPSAEPKDPLEELLDAKVSERLKPFEEQLRIQEQAQRRVTEVQRHEEEARQKYKNYDEIIEPVERWLGEMQRRAMAGDQAAYANIATVMNQPNPAEFAYTLGCRFAYENTLKSQSQTQPQKNEPTKPPVDPANLPRGAGTGGGAGGNDAGLTIEGLQAMDAKEWAKLPKNVRDRLLQGVL